MKLTYENNWESHTYFVGGKEITSLSKVRILEKDYSVTSEPVSIEYYDHGHKGYGTSAHYFVKTKVFGKQMRFDLSRLIDQGVKVEAISYKFYKEDKKS